MEIKKNQLKQVVTDKEKKKEQAIGILTASIQMLDEAKQTCLERGDVSDSVFELIERAKRENYNMINNINELFFDASSPSKRKNRYDYMDKSIEEFMFPLDIEPFRTNRFLVRFPEDFPLKPYGVSKVIKPEFNIKGFSDGVHNNLVLILRNMSYGDAQLLKIWREFNNKKYEYIQIDTLAPNNEVCASDFYTNPIATHVKFNECDYFDDSLMSYEVRIQFDELIDSINKE